MSAGEVTNGICRPHSGTNQGLGIAFRRRLLTEHPISDAPVSPSVTARITTLRIDIGTQLTRDRSDMLLLIVPDDPRQHGDRKGDRDHPVAGALHQFDFRLPLEDLAGEDINTIALGLPSTTTPTDAP